MSGTTRVPIREHAAVKRMGRAPGSVHAAVWVLDGEPTEAQPVPAGHWRTACGEDLRDGPRGTIVRLNVSSVAALVAVYGEHLCRRCDRAGEATL